MTKLGPVTHIVVHYSATYPDIDVSAADVDRWHKQRGFARIGYHYFIRRDGMVELGRSEAELGAHVGGQNTGKIGVCWAGGLERETGSNVGVDNRTPEQIGALTDLLGDLTRRYPAARVVGHRDLAPTQCPGFDVAAWWEEARPKKPIEQPPETGERRFLITVPAQGAPTITEV